MWSAIFFHPNVSAALNSEPVSRQLPDREHASRVVIRHPLSMAVLLVFLSSKTK